MQFNWNDTQLGIKIEGQSEYTYVDLKGQKGDKGEKGEQGDVSIAQLQQAQQELLDDICTTAIITTTSAIAENTDYTIPVKYKAGNNSLEINYMGEKLVKDVHYKEVGEAGKTSNKIQFYNWGQAVPANRTIEFIVRGDYSE